MMSNPLCSRMLYSRLWSSSQAKRNGFTYRAAIRFLSVRRSSSRRACSFSRSSTLCLFHLMTAHKPVATAMTTVTDHWIHPADKEITSWRSSQEDHVVVPFEVPPVRAVFEPAPGSQSSEPLHGEVLLAVVELVLQAASGLELVLGRDR